MVAILGVFAIFLNIICINEKKYQKPYSYIILSFLVLLTIYIYFFAKTLREFNGTLVNMIAMVLIYKILSFSLRWRLPKIRKNYSKVVYIITVILFVSICILNCLGEYLFWDEFGVRYNFIAVDYLVYTNEVIGNIIESYPVVPMFSIVIILILLFSYLIMQRKKRIEVPQINNTLKIKTLLGYVVICLLSCLGITSMAQIQNSDNVYYNELQANSIYKFYQAFQANELEYNKFYLTLNKQEAVKIINDEYNTVGEENTKQIKDSLPEIHKNIVLITVESLSADYIKYFGGKKNITPTIDGLINKSMCFDNLYANGNRTVRGLEAVTLCVPPTQGESVIKGKGNKNFFSIADVVREKGYKVQFLYGGDSYFDNMQEFFSSNGYQILDQKTMKPNDITYKTIWGVCDEDLFNYAINTFDNNAKTNQPFFAHIMTVSNHRPFLYPENKINISPKKKSRDGGVKYTDYAIKQFLEKASQKPWFSNTIFVITADHCASSAGESSIPIDNYHIPCLIFAPNFIKPQKVKTLCSQIDIMPTVFSLLHFSYTSHFYGQDVFDKDYKPRAVLATYQNLGLLSNNILTVISPAKKVEQYLVIPTRKHTHLQRLLNKENTYLINQTIANYQTIQYRKHK
jgi:phosphoglycerol transferase MdoB-like AlkP superfamily enzyme